MYFVKSFSSNFKVTTIPFVSNQFGEALKKVEVDAVGSRRQAVEKSFSQIEVQRIGPPENSSSIDSAENPSENGADQARCREFVDFGK